MARKLQLVSLVLAGLLAAPTLWAHGDGGHRGDQHRGGHGGIESATLSWRHDKTKQRWGSKSDHRDFRDRDHRHGDRRDHRREHRHGRRHNHDHGHRHHRHHVRHEHRHGRHDHHRHNHRRHDHLSGANIWFSYRFGY